MCKENNINKFYIDMINEHITIVFGRILFCDENKLIKIYNSLFIKLLNETIDVYSELLDNNINNSFEEDITVYSKFKSYSKEDIYLLKEVCINDTSMTIQNIFSEFYLLIKNNSKYNKYKNIVELKYEYEYLMQEIESIGNVVNEFQNKEVSKLIKIFTMFFKVLNKYFEKHVERISPEDEFLNRMNSYLNLL